MYFVQSHYCSYPIGIICCSKHPVYNFIKQILWQQELNYRATQPWLTLGLNDTLMAAFYFRSLWGRGLTVSNTINCCQTGKQSSLGGEAKTSVSVRIHVALRCFMWVLTHLGLSRDAMKYCRIWSWLRDTHVHGVGGFDFFCCCFFFQGMHAE